MTDLNTLKNWFKTGLKPTQEQFAAWMDSFFHKGEKIPQSSIEGLDTTLTNKADADQLKVKADLVGGKIPLAQMPFADDVLEFPAQSNFPAQGAVGKIYLDLAADKPFLWDAETSAYKAAGGDDLRMAQIEQRLAGLSNVDNTADMDKPASNPQIAVFGQALAGKVDKPTSDGNWVLNKLGSVFSWVDASNFGKNVANTLLDTLANAGVNMKANWRIATNGYSFSVEGLYDKSTDPKYSQIPVLDSNGVMARSNGSGLMVSGMAAMSDSQKDTWRAAQLKSGENYSLGLPRIDNVVPPMVSRSLPYIQYITIVGTMLYLNTKDVGQAAIEMKRVSDGQVTMINSISSYALNPDKINFGFDFSALTQDADYTYRVFHNGMWSLPNPNAILRVRANMKSMPLPPLTWQLADETGIQTSLPEVNTSSDRVWMNSGTKVPYLKKYYLKPNEPILTAAEMLEGRLLIFDVTLNSGWDDLSAIKIGFVDNAPLANNEFFLNNLKYNAAITYYPSNKAYAMNYETTLVDRLYVTAKNGIVQYFFLIKGMQSSESFASSGDLFLKIFAMANHPGDNVKAFFDIKLASKIKLSDENTNQPA